MKLLFQIFIIVFVILSLFIVKDDIRSLYDRTVAYVKSNQESGNTLQKFFSSSSDEKKSLSDSNPATNSKEGNTSSTTKKPVGNTPGALRVLNNLLTSDASTTTLSQSAVIDLTNANRKANGNLPALKENARLNFSAQQKVQDMFDKQYFEHVSPSGVAIGDLGTKAGYEYIIIGENLALGNFKDNKALVDAWMASPGHRANILNNKYTEIGVAVGQGMFEGRHTWLAVQHFGLPKSACPVIDEVLHGMISLDQTRIKTMETDLAVRKEKIDSGAVYEGSSHNEQIEKYNQLVAVYNDLIAQTKIKIATYNEQVKAFNACIANHT